MTELKLRKSLKYIKLLQINKHSVENSVLKDAKKDSSKEKSFFSNHSER